MSHRHHLKTPSTYHNRNYMSEDNDCKSPKSQLILKGYLNTFEYILQVSSSQLGQIPCNIIHVSNILKAFEMIWDVSGSYVRGILKLFFKVVF